MDDRDVEVKVEFLSNYTGVSQLNQRLIRCFFTFTGIIESLQTSQRIYSVKQVEMEKIKDAIQSMMDEAESKTELPAQDILEEVAEISGTVTFGLIYLLAKALRTFKSAVKEEEIKMKLQDQLRDRWGPNAADLDLYI